MMCVSRQRRGPSSNTKSSGWCFYGAGFVDLPADLHEAVGTAAMDSLVDQGFRRALVWRGCGGHDLTAAVGAFNQRRNGVCEARLPAQPFHAIWCEVADSKTPGGHADSFTVSICLYRYPDYVHPERVPAPAGLDVDWSDPDLDFARYSPTGVIGDPGQASVELGRRLWVAAVDAVASEIAAFSR
jgi:creatinine amidohydrolase